jgi:hypothetical protein
MVMKCEVNSISFVDGNDYLDVDIHYVEKWIELKIDMDGSFPISSQKDLDLIYKKLSKILKSFETNETG